MNNRTDELLHKDSLAESEKMFGGKHWSEFNEAEQLISMFKAMDDNEKKSKHLQSIGDTYWGLKWNDFISLIEQYGFKKGLRYDFVAPKYRDDEEDRIEEAILFYQTEKGLILWATSFGNKDHINSGSVYGMIKYKNWEDTWEALNHSSNGSNGEKDKNIRYFSLDIREGLIHKLNGIDNTLKLLSKWSGDLPFLWFLDYTEEKQPNYDYKAITEDKIKKCPEEMQNIINGCK